MINFFHELLVRYSFFFPALIPAPLLLALFVPRTFANRISHKMGSIVLILALLSLAAALISSAFSLLLAHPLHHEFFSLGAFGMSIYFDAVSAIMLLLVSFLTVAVVSFSKNYLDGNSDQGGFLKWLSITAGNVLLLAVSGNLALFALAWMGVSLSLHKLLSFYGHRHGAKLAARKKFILSRVGDLSFLLALGMVWHTFGTFDYKKLFLITSAASQHSIELIPILLVTAAIIKSAQFPFHGWLPETMEAPTPVSALMHAGIINAGGFLIIRLSPLIVLSPGALILLASVGGFTALFGSLVMITQTSVKRSLAFSTIAQMGFMMFQCGLGAFALALFHIVAHSLYKAYAFLYSGNIVSETSCLGSAPKKRSLGFYRVLVSLLTAGLFVFLWSQILGVSLFKNPTQFALAFILGIALAQLLWNWSSLTHGWSALVGSLFASSVICSLFFLIHIKTELLLGTILPSEFHFGVGWPIAIFTSITFFILALRAFFSGAWSSTRMGRILFVHTYNGFYINTLAHRLLSKLGLSAFEGRNRAKFYDDQQVKKGEEIISQKVSSLRLHEALEQAWKRIPPLWPLSHFVAVNPFIGFSNRDFSSTASLLKRMTGTSLAMPLSFYAERYRSGLITKEDLAKAAIEILGENFSKKSTIDSLISTIDRSEVKKTSASTVPLDYESRSKWESFITQEISKWCVAYFDEGVAAWSFPWKGISLFSAWKAAAATDLNPEIAGITGWRNYIRNLSEDPMVIIQEAIFKLNIAEENLVDFLYSLLMSVNGWAGHLQFLAHEKKLRGAKEEMLCDFLAIRIAYEAAVHPLNLKFSHHDVGVSELNDQLIWQRAHEVAMQRLLFKNLSSPSAAGTNTSTVSSSNLLKTAPLFQAVFCIDVRSEVYRRSLETVCAEVQTIGFAGFFGFPIEFTRAGEQTGAPQCPVLLAPVAAVSESCDKSKLQILGLIKRAVYVWKSFKSSAVSSFVFVEVAGLGFLFSILRALVKMPSTSSPSISCSGLNLEAIPMQTQIALAENALRHMGLATMPLAKIVFLCGHGSTTANNPYASSLDCGACGGHSGEVNARTAVNILNSAYIRAALVKKDIFIPKETYFIAGLHNTTTDEVTLYNTELAPKSHAKEIKLLQHDLAQATLLARKERASLLGLHSKSDKLEKLIKNKSRDWSQVMPEWGLAGNYAFIAAPRARTEHINLEGRVFLHDYSYLEDPNENTLSLLLSAPVIVASWINLQYYASTVDNKHFGSGDKTIHNVAGILGVFEGNGGDIRTGLPLQSVYDGTKWRHEPLRLHVCVEAPKEAIDRVLAQHPSVADLVFNKWIYLFAMSKEATLFEKSNGRGEWSQEQVDDTVRAQFLSAQSIISTGNVA